MSNIKKNTSGSVSLLLLNTPKNDSYPLRIAFLGGSKAGKSSVVSKLSLSYFRETHYPTQRTNPILFTYNPFSRLARTILDERGLPEALDEITQPHSIALSPSIYQVYSKPPNKLPAKVITQGHRNVNVYKSNNYYWSYNYEEELDPNEYTPPRISPLLVELIDTPSYNPDLVVPFLEASLNRELGPEYLRNLANEPRRPVLTNPLLVASGASELNGFIDGYFLVYSAVPSSEPPSYDEISGDKLGKTEISSRNSFDLLSTIKASLDEAWIEYRAYKDKWEKGKESDIFSFKLALKNAWKATPTSDVLANQVHADKLGPINSLSDPANPGAAPPIWILCTNSKSQLASPKLILDGLKLAKLWKCGFVATDCASDNVDEVLAFMVMEIVQRQKMQLSSKNKR